MKTKKMRAAFCVSGKGRLFRAAVRSAKKADFEPVLLIAEAKADPGLKRFCASRRIAYVRLKPGEKGAGLAKKILKAFSENRVSFALLTFDRILPAAVVERYRGRIFNVHPGLLPAFKGFHAIERAAEAGVRYAGGTFHEVTDDVDGGGIVAQCLVAVSPGDTAGTLGKKIYARLEPMTLQALAWFARGRVVRSRTGWKVRGARYSNDWTSPRIE